MNLNKPCGNCGVPRANCSCENLWVKVKRFGINNFISYISQ